MQSYPYACLHGNRSRICWQRIRVRVQSEQHLRHVEKDVLIPKIMREKARERCSEQVQVLDRVCFAVNYLSQTSPRLKSHFLPIACFLLVAPDFIITHVSDGVWRVQRFREQGAGSRCEIRRPVLALQQEIIPYVETRHSSNGDVEGIDTSYKDPAFYEECKMEYLKEREEFRRTGIPTKKRLQKLPTNEKAGDQGSRHQCGVSKPVHCWGPFSVEQSDDLNEERERYFESYIQPVAIL
ncbi:hypothetical protein E5288_WYG019935 [Bos mutus]|uniref:Uncharacterized protein n=1 Tax=Bos mutus TaxID=72004 RepID=A0A6B0RNX7_9CETA|nr:hypothetical protein [Bos mutus]